MGVCALAHLPAGSEVALSARLEQLGCRRHGRWRTQCLYFRPRPRASSAADSDDDAFVISFSDSAAAQLLVRGGKAHAAPADAAQSLASTHVQRLKVAADGSAWQFGDALVRLGPLFLNAAIAGAVVELEYTPCARADAGAALLHEILDVLLLPTGDERTDIPAGGVGAGAFRCTSAPAAAADGAPECAADAIFGRGHAAMQWVEMLRAAHGVGRSGDLADLAPYAPPPPPVT